jgi:hypothetical protein
MHSVLHASAASFKLWSEQPAQKQALQQGLKTCTVKCTVVSNT